MLFLGINSYVMFLSFKDRFERFPVVSLHEIRKYYPNFDNRRLVEWNKKGYITPIKRGFYRFSKQETNQSTIYLIANKIYKPSYISLETALSFYNIIPEAVFTTTSISTLNTTRNSTPYGQFDYKHIKPALYFGYQYLLISGAVISMASPEKAVLDYLYLHPELSCPADFEAMRWNKSMLAELLNTKKILAYLTYINSKKLKLRYSHLQAYMNDRTA